MKYVQRRVLFRRMILQGICCSLWGKMSMKSLVAVATLVIGASTAAHAAPIVIDDFVDEQLVALVEFGGVLSSSEIAASTALGGYRGLSVTSDAAAFFNTLMQTGATSGTSKLDLSNTPGVTGSGFVVWDGAGSAGLGGVDLTDGGTNDAILSTIIFADGASQLEFMVTDTSGTSGTAIYQIPTGISGSTVASVLFSGFTNSVDFTAVDSLLLSMSSTVPGTAFSIDLVSAGVASAPAPVPLPAAGLLLGSVLVGGGTLAARRRKKA